MVITRDNKDWLHIRWTPQPVIVIIRDHKDYIKDLLHSYYATISGWGVRLSPKFYIYTLIF